MVENVSSVNNDNNALLAGSNIPVLTAQEKADLQSIYDLLNNPVDGLQLDFNQLLQNLNAKPPVDPSNLVMTQILPRLQQLQYFLQTADQDFSKDPNPAVVQWLRNNIEMPMHDQFFGLEGPGGSLGFYLNTDDMIQASNIFMNQIANSPSNAGYVSNSLQNLSTYINSVLNPN